MLICGGGAVKHCGHDRCCLAESIGAPLEINPAVWDSDRRPGVLVLFWPGKSILVAAVLFGIYLLVTGVAQVFAAFSLSVASGATQRSQHP
jgi:hypothetical protein